MRVGAYCRVSDKARQADRWSLPAQREAIAAHCRREGWPEPVWYVETHTAKSDDPDARPIFRQLLADAAARKFDTVIVVDTDRFARSVLAGLTAAARLERAGVNVVSLNDGNIDVGDPDGEFNFTLKLMLARRENRVRARKTIAGTAAARAAGRWTTTLPFAGKLDAEGRITVDPALAPLLARILREAAIQSAYSIAAALCVEGLPPPGSRWQSPAPRTFWYAETIDGIVKGGRWLATQPEPWPSLWLAALRRPRLPRARRDRLTRMLSGLGRCKCGGRLYYSGRQARPSFACRNKERGGTGFGCAHRRRAAVFYEEQVAAVLMALPDPAIDLPVQVAGDPLAWANLAEEKRRIGELYRVGIYDDARLSAELAVLVAREAEIPIGTVVLARMRTEVLPVLRIFTTLDPPDQNFACRELIDSVLIDGDTIDIRWSGNALALFPSLAA